MTLVGSTMAADGWPRRAFTVAEVERMVDLGVIERNERFELIGGEIVPMAPKGLVHEVLKTLLIEHWIKAKPDSIMLTPETTLRMSDVTYVEPDIVFYRRSDGLQNLRPETVLLAVEIADNSISFDLNKKPEIYAGSGVAELWVIDARQRLTHVHRKPVQRNDGPSYYADKKEFRSDALITPAAGAGLAVRLDDFQS
jgi:Uma2 family endonuclease